MFTVGTRISAKEATRLPPGSVVEYNGDAIHRFPGGWWYNNAGRERGTYWDSSQMVRQIAQVTVREVGDRPETLDSFRSRFRTTALGSAWAASVTRDPVRGILGRLKARDFVIQPGLWVHPHDQSITRDLPAGTVAQRSTMDLKGFGLFSWNGHEWANIMGDPSLPSLPLRIMEFPEGSEFNDVAEINYGGVGDAEQERRIAMFRSWAWDLGWKAKSLTGWCGEYEQSIYRADITELDNNPGSWAELEGPRTDPTTVPDGSILFRYNHDTGQFGYFIKNGRANATGTTRILGDIGGHTTDDLQVLWRSDSDEIMMIPVQSRRHLDFAPIGTRIMIARGSHTGWVKEDQGWRENAYGEGRAYGGRIADLNQMGVDRMRFTAFPDVRNR